MKTQIQIVGDAATKTIATVVSMRPGKDTGYVELLNFDELSMDSTEELLDLEWYSGNLPVMHTVYIQHIQADETEMVLILTSSGNKTILRLDYDEGDVEDSYVHIAYSGTRGRFVEDLYTCAGILNGYAVQGSNIGNEEGANVMSPDFYESTGPEDMLPWETQGTYLIRLHQQGDVQPLLQTVRRVYSRELTWQSEPKMSSNEELVCNYYMGNVEGAAQVIESILDARWALQQAVDKL